MSAVLALVELSRTVRRPTVFLPGFPSRDAEEFESLAAVARELTRLARGKAITFRMGRSAYPDFDDFPSITAHAGGDYLCTVGGPWASEKAQTEARDELRGRT